MHRYAVAARRARLLADVLRTRRIGLEHRDTLGLIVAYLETAAARLEQYPAPATAEPNGIPRNLADDVDALRELIATVPAGLSGAILSYVTAPLTGTPIQLAPLNPASSHLAHQERRIAEGVAHLAARLDDPRDELVRTYLDGLLSLHNRYDHLAALAPVTPAERTVHVRIGTYRTAYHPHTGCPALTGKPATYNGAEAMTERQARAEGLRACRRCPA